MAYNDKKANGVKRKTPELVSRWKLKRWPPEILPGRRNGNRLLRLVNRYLFCRNIRRIFRRKPCRKVRGYVRRLIPFPLSKLPPEISAGVSGKVCRNFRRIFRHNSVKSFPLFPFVFRRNFRRMSGKYSKVFLSRASICKNIFEKKINASTLGHGKDRYSFGSLARLQRKHIARI
jgi:hypothetical protein